MKIEDLIKSHYYVIKTYKEIYIGIYCGCDDTKTLQFECVAFGGIHEEIHFFSKPIVLYFYSNQVVKSLGPWLPKNIKGRK